MTQLLSKTHQLYVQIQLFRLFCLLTQLYIIHSILFTTLYNDNNTSIIRHILLGKNLYEHVYSNPIGRWFHSSNNTIHCTHTHNTDTIRFCIELIHLSSSLFIPHILQRNNRPYYSYNKKWFILALAGRPLFSVLEYSIPSVSILKYILPYKLSYVITSIQATYYMYQF